MAELAATDAADDALVATVEQATDEANRTDPLLEAGEDDDEVTWQDDRAEEGMPAGDDADSRQLLDAKSWDALLREAMLQAANDCAQKAHIVCSHTHFKTMKRIPIKTVPWIFLCAVSLSTTLATVTV